MGNSGATNPSAFVAWFERSWRTIFIVLVAIMAITLVVIAQQKVDASKPAAGAEPGPIPTFQSAAEPVVAFMGDSYTQGSGQDSGTTALYPSIIGKDLSVKFQNLGDGGAGYVNIGLSGKPFSGQVDSISSNATVVLVYGSRNDPLNTSAAVENTAADDLYAAIRAKVPQAKLVVIGPTFVEDPTPAGGVSNADAIEQAAEDASATYVDASDWFHGTPANYIGTDRIHPTDAGHKYLSTKIEPIVKDALG